MGDGATSDSLTSEVADSLARLKTDSHEDPNPNRKAELGKQPHPLQPLQTSRAQLPCSVPAEVLRHHFVPALSLTAVRAFRRAAKSARDDVSSFAITSIKRTPDTHSLPPDLGCRFPRLTRLDLSGDTQLTGGLELFRALQSASLLSSLSFAGCTALRASFVSRQLVQACPRLQHLALSCCCSPGTETEAAVMASLAAAPLAVSLASLELHCGSAFQPELHHLDGLGAALTSLRVSGSRTLDDEALAALARHAPALVELALAEQQSRRGRHIRGEGLAMLCGLTALRALSLACPEPDARAMAAALAMLTQLRELDLAKCEPRLLEALAPLRVLLGGGGGGGGLLRLSLPTAYTGRQLERGLPVLFGCSGGVGGDAEEGQQAQAQTQAPPLQALHLHASTALPEAVVVALSRLGGMRELSLSHCGPAGTGAAVAAAAAALTGLTSFRLVQEYCTADDDAVDNGAGRGAGEYGVAADEGPVGTPAGPTEVGATEEHPQGGDGRLPRCRAAGTFTWYDGLLRWIALRRLELTDADGLDDSHLYEIGHSLSSLSYFTLSRNARVTGAGFASWPTGCRRLTTVWLYDCARVGDSAMAHLALLPLLTLTLAHLPEVGPAGVRHLAEGCTAVRSLTLERLAGAPGAALAALWRLPQLEALCLRMCSVNNLALQTALVPSAERPTEGGSVDAAVTTGVDGNDNAASGGMTEVPPPPPLVQRLTWLELQGSLVSTSGLWALRHAPGLTHLDLSYCRSVGDTVADVLLLGGGRTICRGAGAGDELRQPGAPRRVGSSAAEVGTMGTSVAGAGGFGALLLPCLVHIDLRGCTVAEATLERLRRAGLVVNRGTGTWR